MRRKLRSSFCRSEVAASLYQILYLVFDLCNIYFFSFFIYLFIDIALSGAGSQSGENQDEEYNEERKKNDTYYNKGTKILFPKETARLLCLPPRPPIKSHTQTLPFETEMATWLLRVLALHEDCMHAPLALRVVMSTSVWFSCCQTSRHLYGRMIWRAPLGFLEPERD